MIRRTLFFFGFWCCLQGFTSSLYAIDWTLGLGYGVVEQGDDHIRPFINASATLDRWGADYYFYGGSFGPVYQKTHALALSRRYPFKLWFVDGLAAKLGVAYLLEQTVVHYNRTEDQIFDSQDEQSNFGMLLGFTYTIIDNFKTCSIDLNWESLVTPAGSSFILLTTGRKEFFYLGANKRI